jgi:nucleoside-diphosphate-sugar epimerase
MSFSRVADPDGLTATASLPLHEENIFRASSDGAVERPVAAVTGANGYLGSIVCNGMDEAGFDIRRLIRNPESGSGDRAYDIAAGCSPDALNGVDLLVHCAYDLAATSRSEVWSTNVYGTRRLLDLALSSHVRRTIVISSMSAYRGTGQIYGRAKLATETDALARNMCVVRPGLVYGAGWGGMAGTLRKLVGLPLIPLVARNAHQFTLHEDDFRKAIVLLAGAQSVPARPIGLAYPEPMQFEALLRAFARVDSKVEPRFVSVPWRPLYVALRAAELASVPLPVRADSLLGLVRPAPSVPNTDDVEELGIGIRPFEL